MKKAIITLYIVGLIAICSFCTPILIKRGGHVYKIEFSHIFSTRGEIATGRLFLYFIIWTAPFFAYKKYIVDKKK